MNAKQFMELLKNLQKMMKCPSCGEAYRIEEVQFVAQMDGFFLLQMVCGSCELPVSMNIMTPRQNAPISQGLSDLNNDELQKDQYKEPITTNEVIDFHNFIQDFKGKF